MEIYNALEFMAKCAKQHSADQFDILAGVSENCGVDIYQGKVKETEIASSQGIGIRLIKNGKPGYSYTKRLSEESLQQCVADAVDLAEFTAPLSITLPSPTVLPKIKFHHWNEKLESLTTEDFLKKSFEIEKLAKNFHPEIENILSSSTSKSKSAFYILNSNGLDYKFSRNSVSAGLSLVAARGNIKKSGGHYKTTRNFAEIKAAELVSRATAKAVDLLDAKPIKAGKYPVLFDHYTAPALLDALMPAFFAQVVQKGQSKFAGKIGEKIASSCLTICNDPFIIDLPGSELVDSEGVPTQKFNVVENGILQNFLHNLESAHKDGVKPTGSGSRSYSGSAGTDFQNLIIPKGSRGKQEILNNLTECLVVTKFEGSGIRSATSGEISLGCQGFLYSRGELVQAVDRVTLSGNYFDLLHNISEFSNEYSDSFSSTKIADMLIESMNISC